MYENYGELYPWLQGCRKLRMKQRRAIYAFYFVAIKRLATQDMYCSSYHSNFMEFRMVFNCTWDKTLSLGVDCFGFFCVSTPDSAYCVIHGYVAFS